MKIEKISQLSGKRHTREIDVTEEQIAEWQRGLRNIQDVMPHLSADDREFLLTGSTPEEWDAAFGDEESGDEMDDEPAF